MPGESRGTGEGLRGDAQSAVERASALVAMGRSEQAIVEMHRALEADPQNPSHWAYLAQLQVEVHDYDGARRSAESALAIAPDNARALNAMISIAFDDGDTAEALRVSDRLLSAAPGWPAAHAQRARALLTKRRTPAIVEEIERHAARALELAPHEPVVYGMVAFLRTALGDHAGAQRLVDAGLAIAPNDADLLQAKARSVGVSDLTAARILAGVLAQNPGEVSAARAVHGLLWARVERLVTISTAIAVCAGIASYAFFPFGGKGVNLAVVASGVIFAWVMFFARFRRALPKGHLRRALVRVPESILALVLSALATLLLFFVLLALGLRNSPEQLEMYGPYVAGFVIGLGYAAAILALAECLVVVARYRSAARNGLLFDGAGERPSSRASFRHSVRWAATRAGVVVLVVIVAMAAGGVVARPEALLGVVTLGVLAVVPAGASLIVAGIAYRREQGVRSRRRVAARTRLLPALALAGGLVVVLGGGVGAGALLSAQESQYDPPEPHYPWDDDIAPIDFAPIEIDLGDPNDPFGISSSPTPPPEGTAPGEPAPAQPVPDGQLQEEPLPEEETRGE